MKLKIYILFLLVFSLHNIKAQVDSIDCLNSFTPIWAKNIGSTSSDQVLDIVSDNQGNIVIVGFFHESLSIQSQTVVSNGGSDFFVAKFDNYANLLWLKSGGGEENDLANSVSIDSEGRINIIGNFRATANFNGNLITSGGESDVFIIQYSAEGDYLWGKFLSGFYDNSGNAICVDNQDNILISGAYDGHIAIGNSTLLAKGGIDFFLAKYDKNGNFLWRVNHGSIQNDFASSIVCDKNNNVFIAGEFSGTINFGSFNLPANGSLNTFVAKYDKSGAFKWAKAFGEATNTANQANIDVDIFENSYISYKSEQANNMVKIHKLNSEGVEIFNTSFGGLANVFPNDIKVDIAQNIFIAGKFSGLADFGDGNINANADFDCFISKLDNDGIFKIKEIKGVANSNSLNSIYINKLNQLSAAGYFSNTISFNPETLNSNGEEDGFIVNYPLDFGFSNINISSNNCDPNDMCIEVQIINGVPPFTYYYNNEILEQNVCGLSIGNYDIHVVDKNYCYIKTNVELNPLEGPEISLPENISVCPFESKTLNAGNGNFEYLWSTNETTQTIEVSEAGEYSVTVTDLASGCSSSASTNLTQIPNPDLLPETDSLCFGDELTITSFDTYTSYFWSNASTNQYFTSGNSGHHWLRVFDSHTQCYFYDTISFIYYPKIELNLENEIIICDGDSVLISAPAGFVSYQWSDGRVSENIWLNQAGIYTLTVSDENSCTASEDINVSLGESPIINLGDDFSICTNQAVILNPNAQDEDLIYLWNDNSSENTLTITSSGTYWVRVSASTGCDAIDSIKVEIFPQPILNLGDDIEFCYGESYFIEVDSIYTNYQWSNGLNTNSILVNSTQTLFLTVTDTNNCTAKDSINIIEHDLVQPFIGYDTVFCEGNKYTLRTDKEYDKYLWQNGSTSPTFSVTQAGQYALTVYDNIGCFGNTEINIEFAENPVWDTYSSEGGIIEVFASGGVQPYVYSHDGDTWQNSNSFTNLPSGLYIISIMDQNYCMISQEVYLDESLNIPNFFTPNGDGYNDTWLIYGLYHYPDAIVEIFDRFGKKLYMSSDANFSWDGVYNGQSLPSDTYWYVITLDANKKNVLKGSVTIKR
ncbi:MAG: T9SS type B sorting domain-containing protein [Bacteroidales bacterium]|nr:T9SS type B sorting domain-containing protein [Bacteroidales bacterium]